MHTSGSSSFVPPTIRESTFRCLLLGRTIDQSFDVKIEVGAYIEDLKKEIVKSEGFPGVTFGKLTLYRVPNGTNVTTEEELSQVVESVTRDEKNVLGNIDIVSSVLEPPLKERRIHLLVDYDCRVLGISCILKASREYAAEDIFHVDIENTRSVYDLARAIKEGISIDHIILRRVSVPTNNLGILNITEGTILVDPTERLSKVFPSLPSAHVHVLVETKDTPVTMRQKRTLLEPADDVFSRFKRTKLATTSPSEISKLDAFLCLQRSSENVLDDRPVPDPDIPPIPLLYEGFGYFLDIMRGREDVPGLDDVDVPELRSAVDDLAIKMEYDSANDADKMYKALPILNRIFSARRGIKIPPLDATDIGPITDRSNAHNISAHGTGLMVKFNNRVTGIRSLPHIELLGYIAHLAATRMSKQLFLGWRVPYLGLTIVDCDITFYSVVLIDHRFRLLSLTPIISCIRSASCGHDREALYAAFTAASVLQACILQDTERLLNNPPAPIPDKARYFPAVSKLRMYPKISDEDYFTFEIQDLLPGYHHLYIAETQGSDRQLVLIKFTQQYSIELHEFCADLGHAPRIFAFQRLPGGWYAVAMEYIESGFPIIESPLLPLHRDRWITELQELMNSFHENNLVHGDLRDINIICKDDTVHLVDFDWGGKDGEVSYPTPKLDHELLCGMAGRKDLIITKDNDRLVLNNTLAKLR